MLTGRTTSRTADRPDAGTLARVQSWLAICTAVACGLILNVGCSGPTPGGSADDPSLQSCDMLLADRPTARPYITAAIDAAVADGMAGSAASLRANLSGIEIGDNPLPPGSLVAVLVVAGAPPGTIEGHTVDGPNRSKKGFLRGWSWRWL